MTPPPARASIEASVTEARMQDDHGLRQKAGNDLVLSFLAVRRSIGALGFFLPLALLAYAAGSGAGVMSSISASYYGPMREIFVGTLCAQAVFLWSYEGYRPRSDEWITDRGAARTAAVAAALIALAPTTPGAPLPPGACTLLQCALGTGLAALVHLGAAAAFFGALAVTCLVLFTRGDDGKPEKRAANRIYRICGWTIVLSIGAIGILFATGLDAALAGLRPVFWLETIATFAFATSWAVKGDALRPLVRMALR